MAIHQKLTLERTFNHSAHYIYKVFTQAEYMKVWWSEDTRITSQHTVGGKWRIERPFEGEWFIYLGTFLELIADEMVVYSYKMPMFSDNEDVITIKIKSITKDQSHITFIQEGADIAAELDALEPGYVSESEQGWIIAFELIDKAL